MPDCQHRHPQSRKVRWSTYSGGTEIDMEGLHYFSTKQSLFEMLHCLWKLFMEKNKLTKMPTLSAVKVHMDSTGRLNIILVLPVGTASVERDFSYMKLIKAHIRNSITDRNLSLLMRIAIEGPELSAVNFMKLFWTFSNKKIEEFRSQLLFVIIIKNSYFCGGGGRLFLEGIPAPPPPPPPLCMKPPASSIWEP